MADSDSGSFPPEGAKILSKMNCCLKKGERREGGREGRREGCLCAGGSSLNFSQIFIARIKKINQEERERGIKQVLQSHPRFI